MLSQKNTFEFLTTLLNIDSPSSYTKNAIDFLEQEVKKLGYAFEKTNKGNLVITIPGHDSYVVGIATHVDTLGLMVRSINENGTLNFTNIGGINIATLDSEYVRVITRDNKIFTGTIRSNATSSHVYRDATTKPRNADEMHIQLDIIENSKQAVLNLGIQNGDIIAVDTKTTITETGFIKSRFLDDKASVALMFSILKHLHQNQLKPKHTLKFMITTYEEVGHGASYIDKSIHELLAVDMGCIGKDLSCSEFDVSICAKDSSGPYDYAMTSDLINIAKQLNLNYVVDIYPFYGSDASAALSGGANIKAALIGPGIASSHGLERTHFKAIENTIKLILGYIL